MGRLWIYTVLDSEEVQTREKEVSLTGASGCPLHQTNADLNIQDGPTRVTLGSFSSYSLYGNPLCLQVFFHMNTGGTCLDHIDPFSEYVS